MIDNSSKGNKKPKLTPTQAKVVKAKIKAELQDIPQKVVAQEVWPNAKPATAEMMMSREIRKDNVQEALQKAFEKYDLTPDRLTAVVADAMGAEKTVILGNGEEAFADVVPDHGIRLKAAGMAANWMGVGKLAGESGTTNLNFINVSRTDKGDYGL